MRRLRVAAPWLVAALILGALLVRVDPAATLARLAQGRLARHVPIAGAFGLLWLALDARGLAWVFAGTGVPIRWADMLRLRARSYPPMVLSFHLGSAALAALLQRATGAPLARTASALLLHYAADLCALAAVAAAGSLCADLPGAPWLRGALGALALGLAGGLLACRRARARLPHALQPLGALPGPEIARLVALRALFHASFAGFVWLTLPAYGLALGLVDVLVRMPLVLAAGALPLTPGGLGTAQAAFVLVFRDRASEPALLAYALAYGATLLVLRLALGFGAWLLPAGSGHAAGAPA